MLMKHINQVFSSSKSYSINRILSFNFTSKLYNKENLKFQKTFKFSSKSENKNEKLNREKYLKNEIEIKELENGIKKEKFLMYTTIGGSTEKGTMILMKKDDTQDMEVINDDVEILKPVNLMHKKKKDDLEEKRQKLVSENENIKLRYFVPTSKKHENDNEYEVIRVSYIRDMFSGSFSFGNRYLNPETFERVNKQEDDKPKAIKLQEVEISTKQSNLENEISGVLDDMINKEFETFDVESSLIPHRLAAKPIIRSICADLNQPQILLVESDLNLNYGLDLEYERLLRLTRNDDFGQKIKEEQDKEEEKEEIAQEDEKELFNDGNHPTTLFSDPSISILSK